MLLVLVGTAFSWGTSARPAEAVPKVNAVVKCDGNPEAVRVVNNTNRRIKVKEVGSIYRPYGFEPVRVNRVLRRGRAITFESGPRANTNVLTKQYIFNSSVGDREGARVFTSVGRFSDRCN